MSEHKSDSIMTSLAGAFEELKIQNPGTVIGFGLRDKTDPMGAPQIVTISDLQSIVDFLDAAPLQVHYLLVTTPDHAAGEDLQSACKVSYTPVSRAAKYNLAGNGKNYHSNTFDVNFVLGALDVFDESVHAAIKDFLGVGA